MNENFYLSIDELCTLEQTDALLTLGMGTERLYYEEQSGHYLFPLSSAIKWIRENKGINIRANYRYIARDWFADWLNLCTSEYDDTSEYYPTKEAAESAMLSFVLTQLNRVFRTMFLKTEFKNT